MARLKLNEGLKETGPVAFINYIRIPSSVEAIGQFFFQEWFSLMKLGFKEGLRAILESAFADCTISRFRMFLSVEILGPTAFKGCLKVICL